MNVNVSMNMNMNTLGAQIEAVSDAEVQRVLAAPGRPPPSAAPVLLSPAARPHLEQMAQRARAVTRRRFGRTITLYAPLYLSSHCVNHCTYCGFAAPLDLPRRALSADEAAAEARALRAQGIRHLLLVTGEAPARYGLDALCQAVRRIRAHVASVAVEIAPCDEAGYRRLIAAGVDGLVLYQETYDPALYARLHPAGPKRSFTARLDAVEAGGRAGFRSLGIGALLGLAPWRAEVCALAWHGRHLARRFPGSRLAFSFPRLRPVAERRPEELYPLSDADLVQAIVVTRLLFPDAELVVSTREPAWLRDQLIPLGVTRMSAGSRTSPGAYGAGAAAAAGARQFETDDRRPVADVAAAIRAAGYDVVTKDFDSIFMQGEA